MKSDNKNDNTQKGDKRTDLVAGSAIEKLKELIKHNSICMFTTSLDTKPLDTRPMSVQKVDDEGNLWLLSSLSSDKNQEIAVDNHVQLFFSNVSDQEYLSVFGIASITKDINIIKDLWNPIAKAWFPGGVDDPEISAIKIEPQDAFYWDTKNGRMVSLIKILASAVTGHTLEEGVQGKLSVY